MQDSPYYSIIRHHHQPRILPLSQSSSIELIQSNCNYPFPSPMLSSIIDTPLVVRSYPLATFPPHQSSISIIFLVSSLKQIPTLEYEYESRPAKNCSLSRYSACCIYHPPLFFFLNIPTLCMHVRTSSAFHRPENLLPCVLLVLFCVRGACTRVGVCACLYLLLYRRIVCM
ncbi:hypothetical protein BJ912DRAFT_690143 [Pholiota molesta]|nr:hypothetical protein BJ912DRAFT_690143 [Pholiota molesta]